jgi:hypothetical protein
VPFLAASPFSALRFTYRRQLHVAAFIEKRFLSNEHLTFRDQYAHTLEDIFDFDH